MQKLAQNEAAEKCAATARPMAGAAGRGKLPARCRVVPVPGPDPEPEFLVHEYDGSTISERLLTEVQVRALDPNTVDCHVDEVSGLNQIRASDGQILGYQGRIAGLGEKVGRRLLCELMWTPGRLHDAMSLYSVRGLESLLSADARAAWVQRLRKAFGETRSKPWFFVLCDHPWRLGWHRDRTWRVIEALAGSSGSRAPRP